MKLKVVVFLLTFLVLFTIAQGVLAQEETPTTGEEEVVSEQEVQAEINQEENITPQDLEIKDPKLLPDNPFYFVKNWWRGLCLAFIFDPVKKAQLRERFANEKLIELKKLIEKKKDPRVIEKAKKNYERELEILKKMADRLKKVKDRPRVELFLDKFVRHQILHQKLLEKLENQVPPQTFKKIKEIREKHLERFKDVMLKLEDKDRLPERLEKVIEKMKGSDFKEIKALEILKKLEEKVKDKEAKEAIQKARERILEKAKTKIEKLPKRRRIILKRFIEKLPGDKEKQLEILEDLKERLRERKEIREELEEGRVKILEKLLERKKKMLEERGCPVISPPGLGFCKDGRVVIKKDEKGCLEFVCLDFKEIRERIRKMIKEHKEETRENKKNDKRTQRRNEGLS